MSREADWIYFQKETFQEIFKIVLVLKVELGT